MKHNLLICTLVLGLGGLACADPAAELSEAAKKLAAAKSYTSTSSMAFGDNEPRVSTIKKGVGGYTLVSYPGRDETRTMLIRGDKVAFQTDDGWEVADTVEEGEGDEARRGRWMARMAERYAEPPTERINELIEAAGALTGADGTYTATLGEEAAKELMSFRGPRGGDDADRQPPPINGAGGSVKFMVKDGVLAGYELTLSGRMTFNDQERDIGRTTKVEFSAVGSTTFDIPEEAAGLLASQDA